MKDLRALLNSRKDLKKISFDDKDVFCVFSRVIKKEFGEIGSGKFQFEFFGKKVLVVKCASSAWASELWVNREKIIRLMNDELGDGVVEKVKTK